MRKTFASVLSDGFRTRALFVTAARRRCSQMQSTSLRRQEGDRGKHPGFPSSSDVVVRRYTHTPCTVWRPGFRGPLGIPTCFVLPSPRVQLSPKKKVTVPPSLVTLRKLFPVPRQASPPRTTPPWRRLSQRTHRCPPALAAFVSGPARRGVSSLCAGPCRRSSLSAFLLGDDSAPHRKSRSPAPRLGGISSPRRPITYSRCGGVHVYVGIVQRAG